MNTLRGHVLLDPGEADYLARALALLQQMLRENRCTPTPRLETVARQLARCAETGSAAAPNGSTDCRCGASHKDTGHHHDYAWLNTAEAAKVLGTGERNVRDLAARGSIPARRAGERGRWLIDAGAVVERAEHKAERKAARRAG
ncbi:hypothetical protein MGALJ_48510 [Mycobacterium gallinarum]|uniref:Helix-turn-helix domain-containing protein n=1 Tax=Mycobacterium gallinarum TaxID=39689 RepID=A0A9W4B785_9MYCO|nr:helix-turn-helix domain-containing protein [Mycobacterium gallinarum]BBY95182.1 hypothetical protein MGALJ_48510 [Mycobacterium gallinarum]